jgi:hypothetical protein
MAPPSLNRRARQTGIHSGIHAQGSSAAPITTGRGFEMRPDIRNNDRVIIDDQPFAADLYQRLADAILETLFSWRRIGLNEGSDAIAIGRDSGSHRIREVEPARSRHDSVASRTIGASCAAFGGLKRPRSGVVVESPPSSVDASS